MKRVIKLGLLLFVFSLEFTSCTIDDDHLFESSKQSTTKDTSSEDADPEIEDPNGE